MIPDKMGFSAHPTVQASKIFQTARAICEELQRAGHEACFVGGCVRDFFLQPEKIPPDIDISSSAPPPEILRLFPGSGFVGKAFGVSLVRKEKLAFEVSAFRKEGTYSDRRHPDSVETGTMAEDSNRRDFTVNALYFDPVAGVIIDFHGGVNDLNNRILKCVGNANDRLYEDSLRIMRLFRFSANSALNIDAATLTAAKKESEGLAALSKERMVMEIVKVHSGKFDSFASSFLREIPCNSFERRLPHPEKKPLQISFSPDFHRAFPVCALAAAVFSVSPMPAQSLWNAFHDWPTTTDDMALLRFMTFDFQKWSLSYSTTRVELQIFWFLRMLKSQRLIHANDFAALMVQFCQQNPCPSFIDRLIVFLESQTETMETLLKSVFLKTPGIPTAEIMEKIAGLKLSQQYVGIWTGWQEAVALMNAIQIKIPLDGSGETTPELLSLFDQLIASKPGRRN